MQFLILIPSLIVFLYCLYKLVKDDYILIRRNVSLEQIFDITFVVILGGIFFSRLLAVIIRPVQEKNIFVSFFSPANQNFSFPGAVIGAALILYLIGKYKKIPIGRLFDFVALAFLATIPLGFTGYALLLKKSELFFYLLNGFVYLLFTIFFMKFLYPKLMSRSLREGNLSLIFLICFSLVSLFTAFVNPAKMQNNFLTAENIILTITFLFSLFFLFKHVRQAFRSRR